MAPIKFTPVPIRHSDAIGYLKDLATAVGESWFEMICDLATAHVSNLDDQNLAVLFALHQGNASYLRPKTQPTLPALVLPSSSADFLEELSGFVNFKLLAPTLKVIFEKRITLIFGANGSGKSSICECLKVLANPEPPVRPLHNVRVTGTTTPTFCYRFKSYAATKTWTRTTGYGTQNETIKYFDTGIAIRNIENAVQPGRLVELTPFKLHVFELAMNLTTQFRDTLEHGAQKNSLALTASLETIRADLGRFKRFPWATNDEAAISFLPKAIDLAETFAVENILNEKRKEELEKATSEQGVRLLKAEHHELDGFLNSLCKLLDSVQDLWSIQSATKVRTLAAKKVEQEILGKTLIPKEGDLEGLLKLLRAAEPLCKFDVPEGHACPLCKRELQTAEINLFKQYHELLVGEIHKDITDLSNDIERAQSLVQSIQQVNRKEWENSATIPIDILTTAKRCSDVIVESCELADEPTAEANEMLTLLRASSLTWTQQLQLKAAAD